ncbi:substrate-binding and VWA domain-containing protein [Herbihabitans rhizosphaerae]|uniref:substrate-binding and VWA domain-containing protein n=1 Tax=Herbihabitans rhizosphaerae TaxID=1872711 RepID=UPI001F5E719E|nr:substrate-binding and VWA domain-containing protein [Herbihabitans rhizosphaerae]
MVLLAVLLVLSVVAWLSYDFIRDQLRSSGCESTTNVTVAAAPEIAPALGQVAREPLPGGGCYKIDVVARESSSVAESLAISANGEAQPDAWVPDSTVWLQRARGKTARDVPEVGTSVASSPVVLALTDDTASQLGWPDKPVTWSDVLAAGDKVAVGMADPTQSPVGVSALLATRAATASASDPAAANIGALRRLSPNTENTGEDLFARLPGAPSADGPLGAFPTSENEVLRHNVKAAPGSQLVAAYAVPGVPPLDYPYVVLPSATGDRRVGAERFLAALLESPAGQALSDAGFRARDGKALRDRSHDKRTTAQQVIPVPVPSVAELDQLLNGWAGVNYSARIQVLLDVSGSMNGQVPGAGVTRMAATLRAAELGIRLMKESTKIGLWEFSTDMAGEQDYRETIPVAPIGEQLRGGMLDRLRAIAAKPNGNTALYDSTLAIYRAARQAWEPGRINLVIVMTDGKDDNAHGLTRPDLLAELAKLQDPRRPLQIIGIGLGPDIDVTELNQIAAATGGQAYTTNDPARISDVFYAALSRMVCQPPACKK